MLTRLYPFNLCGLRPACLLAVLRLKLIVTNQPPKTCYPVAGLPSGVGFSPTRLHDLAWPHCECIMFNIKKAPALGFELFVALIITVFFAFIVLVLLALVATTSVHEF
jgi:hypothetical protein